MEFRPLHDRVVVRNGGPAGTAARPFSFPHEVVEDPSLSQREKRAILSEWASDACAVESFPTLRWLPGTTFPVTFSAVMDARQWLDRQAPPRDISAERCGGDVILADFRRRNPVRSEGGRNAGH